MATVEELQAQLDKLTAEKSELEKRANGVPDIDDVVKRTTELEAKFKAAEEENRSLKINLTKKEILQQYPAISSFETMLTGNTPDELKKSAEDMNKRVTEFQKQAEEKAKADIAKAWGSIPGGAPAGMLRMEELDAKEKEARDKKDWLTILKIKGARLTQKNAAAH